MYSYVVVSSCDVNSLYSLRINTDEHPIFQFVFTEGFCGCFFFVCVFVSSCILSDVE